MSRWHRFSKKSSTIHEDSYATLSQYIENYRKNREVLISTIMSTIHIFNKISNLLNEEVVECFDVKSLVDLIHQLGVDSKNSTITFNSELKIDSSQIENPGILIIGQLKAGKSMFVNSLIRKNVVYQSFDRCTDRVTRISFNERNILEILDENGVVLRRRHLSSYTIPKKYLKLSEGDRKLPSELNKMIRSGINVKFLKCGIDLIDTPGITNIKDLYKCITMFNVLPIVIYVIDGRAGVKQSDTADILELKSMFPHLEIIYFLTHLDTDNTDEFENVNDSIEISKLKMNLAFKKLQFHNFISTTIENWTQCPYIYGASLTCLVSHSMNRKSPEIDYHFQQFCRFQSALINHISVYFEHKIFESCDLLINFQMDLCTKIIDYAKNFATKFQENFQQITSMKEIEYNMYLKIKSSISDSKTELLNRLIERLEQESKDIIGPILDTVYPSFIKIPENGIVDDPLIVDQCQTAIIKVLIQGLEDILKNFVEEELFKNFRIAVNNNLFHSLRESFLEQSIQKPAKSPYKCLLERILNRKYKLESLSSIYPEGEQTMVIEFMNVVLSSVKTFLADGLLTKLKDKEINVKNPEWKLKQAEEYLNRCDHHLLAEEVCKGLFDDFEKKHKEFLKAMEIETRIIEKKIVDSENTRLKIAERAPKLFLLFLYAINIKGKYIFKDVKERDLIGEGPKSKVHICDIKDETLAMKVIDLDVYSLKNISEEIFYARQFSHFNLLPVEGISISENEKQIRIFYPLKKMDLGHYMKINVINSMTALKISLQVADALRYLHNHGTMHKDLKLTNILINNNEDVTLSDYGFCKSWILTKSWNYDKPIHIAPEFNDDNFDSTKIDIYSFGIMMWYLFEGTGRMPKFAFEFQFQVFWEKYKFKLDSNMRPDKLKKIPEPIWEIMQKCWSEIPDDRPNIDVLISELQSYFLQQLIN